MSKTISEPNIKIAFPAWLEIAYLTWQAKSRKRATLNEFADYIGYSRPLISMWLAGKRLPTREGVDRLAKLFGDDIYDILGIPRPNPYLQKINQVFERLSPERQQKLSEDAARYETEALKNERSKKPSKERKTQPR